MTSRVVLNVQINLKQSFTTLCANLSLYSFCLLHTNSQQRVSCNNTDSKRVQYLWILQNCSFLRFFPPVSLLSPLASVRLWRGVIQLCQCKYLEMFIFFVQPTQVHPWFNLHHYEWFSHHVCIDYAGQKCQRFVW